MDFEFETTRTCLANAFEAAGAELLGYIGIADTAVAAIPDTQPQKYAIAGTLPGILQMAGQMMGEDAAEKPTGDLTEKVRAAMIRAYSLGQTWWQQADSEYSSENKKADITASRFIELNDELCAAIAAHLERQALQPVADAFRSHVGAIATDDAAGPYVKFRFRTMADADAALESIIASIVAPSSQEGAHAARNAVLEEAANALDLMNDSAGDRAAHEQCDMLCCETERMWTLINAAKAIRALQTPAIAERSGE